jgi:hypothetical protein
MRYNPLCTPSDVVTESPEPDASRRAPMASPARTNPITAGNDCVAFSENVAKKGIELRFDKAPPEAIRTELKNAGWRWSRFGGCWYTRDHPDNRKWANEFIKRYSTPPEVIGSAIVAAPGSAFEAELKAVMPESPKDNRGYLEKLNEAILNLRSIEGFIGRSQRAVVLQNFKGEEKQYFFDLVKELGARIAATPQTYEGGRGDQAVAHLHYFGGSANWYITERDKGMPDEQKIGAYPPQHQAYGLADLFGDGGERGYISIAEILQNGGELDFHFTPKTLAEIQGHSCGPLSPAPVVSVADCKVPLWRQRMAGRASAFGTA